MHKNVNCEGPGQEVQRVYENKTRSHLGYNPAEYRCILPVSQELEAELESNGLF